MTSDEQRMAQLLHAARDTLKPGDPVVPPIVPAAAFHLPGDPSAAPFVYGRYANPTWEALEHALGILEDAPVVTFPSGMAAIAAVLFSNAQKGRKVLVPADGYHATRALARQYLAPMGIAVVERPVARFGDGGFEGFGLVLMETPSNPGLDLCDIAAIARDAKAKGAVVVADNTTMTALAQRPLDLGCDLVLSAATKAVNGHSDVLLGYVASRDAARINVLKDWRRLSGAIPSPFDAFLVHRGLETLELRLARATSNAAALAKRFAGHPKLLGLRYPGLPPDPAHALAQRQMQSYGFMLTMTFADGNAAERFISACRLVQASTSFGGVRTSAERRSRWKDAVPDGFVRVSAGIEPEAPLLDAFAEALEQV